MVTHTSRVRFEGEGIFRGRAIWQLDSNGLREAAIIRLRRPDGQPLLAETIVAIEQVEQRPGYKDPRTLLKTVGVTAGSFVLGGLIGEIFDLVPVEEAAGQLASAVSSGNAEAIEAGLAAWNAAAENGGKEAAAIFVGLGMLVGPSTYAGYALSRRIIRIRIQMDSGAHYLVQCPEFMGAFLMGSWTATTVGIQDSQNDAQEPDPSHVQEPEPVQATATPTPTTA